MKEDTDISLLEIIESYKKAFLLTLKKWMLILLVGIGLGIIGLLYSAITKDKYIAELNFVAENNAGNSLSAYAGIASQFGIDLGSGSGGIFDGDNLVELIKSKNLVRKTLLTTFDNNSLLIDKYISENNLNKNNLVLGFDKSDLNQKWLCDSMLNIAYEKIIKNNLSVEKFDKKLDFIAIKFESSNQFFAKKFVDNLASETIQFYSKYKNQKNESNVATIQKQVDSVRNLLFGEIYNIAQNRDLNVNLQRQEPQVSRQKNEVNKQVSAAVYEELQKNLQIALLIKLKESPLIKIIDTPTLPLKNLKMKYKLSIVLFSFTGMLLLFLYFFIFNVAAIRSSKNTLK